MSAHFYEAIHDSGYFLSNRETDIARRFYEAGKADGDETKRELLGALESIVNFVILPDRDKRVEAARAIIAKAKEAQP